MIELTRDDCKKIAKLVGKEVVVSEKVVGKDKQGKPILELMHQQCFLGGIEKELVSILPQLNAVIQAKQNK